MPDTLEAEEAVRGMSDSARKAKPIAPPPPSDDEAAEPALVRAARDVTSMSARQSEAIIRSWEETVRLGLDGFAAWASARDIWAEKLPGAVSVGIQRHATGNEDDSADLGPAVQHGGDSCRPNGGAGDRPVRRSSIGTRRAKTS
jgi:hypothetical protein